MKKIYVITFLTILIGINLLLIAYFMNKKSTQSQSSTVDPTEECRKKSIVWNKNEYEIPSREIENKFVLKVEDKNINKASFNFKPGTHPEKDFTHCQASISKIPFYENMPESLKKEHKYSKGVNVSVGTRDLKYTPIVPFIMNIQVYVKRKNNEDYDFDKTMKDIVSSYKVEKENNILRVTLKGREDSITSEFSSFIVEYNGKNMIGKDLELISEDEGKTWKVEIIQNGMHKTHTSATTVQK